jgi:hypothetical protein
VRGAKKTRWGAIRDTADGMVDGSRTPDKATIGLALSTVMWRAAIRWPA